MKTYFHLIVTSFKKKSIEDNLPITLYFITTNPIVPMDISSMGELANNASKLIKNLDKSIQLKLITDTRYKINDDNTIEALYPHNTSTEPLIYYTIDQINDYYTINLIIYTSKLFKQFTYDRTKTGDSTLFSALYDIGDTKDNDPIVHEVDNFLFQEENTSIGKILKQIVKSTALGSNKEKLITKLFNKL